MNTLQKTLSVGVLLAALWQVYAAATIAIDAFTENSFNGLLNFIQPAGFIFSIWGLIYTLAILFAIYQLLPKNNSAYLEYARPYVIGAFALSGVWLYFAGLDQTLLWVTAPILFAIAWMLYKVVTYQLGARQGKTSWERLVSTYTLYPYAAWTLIASGVNVHSLLIQYGVIETLFWNVFWSLFILVLVTILSHYTLIKLRYSPWYGLVLVWATFGIVWTNTIETDGAWLVALAAGIVSVYTLVMLLKKSIKQPITAA